MSHTSVRLRVIDSTAPAAPARRAAPAAPAPRSTPEYHLALERALSGHGELVGAERDATATAFIARVMAALPDHPPAPLRVPLTARLALPAVHALGTLACAATLGSADGIAWVVLALAALLVGARTPYDAASAAAADRLLACAAWLAPLALAAGLRAADPALPAWLPSMTVGLAAGLLLLACWRQPDGRLARLLLPAAGLGLLVIGVCSC